MHNNLDKQPVKQNTPIVAIGGCGQVLGPYSNYNILITKKQVYYWAS